MAGRGNRGSRQFSASTGRGADPDWTPRPARAYEDGNLDAVSHGAYSSALVSADAAEMIESMRDRLPWLMAECDGLVLDTLIRSVVRWRRLDSYIEANEIEKVKDSVWQQVDREQRYVLAAAGKMGMTAVDRAALMKDASWARALQRRGEGPVLGERGRAMRIAQGRLPTADDDADED